MKKTILLVMVISCLMLAACGGPKLDELKIHTYERNDDKYKVEMSFDQKYKDVKLVFHSDINNDSFEGTAEYTYDVGAVEPGQMYTEDVKAETWSYSGTFKSISMGNGSLDLNPPDVAKEKVKVIVKDGEKELMSSEAK